MSQPIRTEAEWARDNHRRERDTVKLMQYVGIPEPLRKFDWDDYEDDVKVDGGFRLKDWLIDYAEHYGPGETMGAVLLGAAGWGKTLGLCLLGIHLSVKLPFRERPMVKYVTYSDLVEMKKELIRLERDGERTDDWQAYNRQKIRVMLIEDECDVLLLDDIGKEYRAASGWSDAGLDRLLRSREAQGKVTFLASNLSRNEWASYNPSMLSFLYQIGDVLELVEGRDHRHRLTEAQKERRARLARR